MKNENKKLKIGLILDSTLDVEDGVQQYVLTLGKYLSSQGHEVHYIAGQTSRSDIKNLHSFSRNIRLMFNGNRVSISLPVRSSTIKKFFDQHCLDVLHIQSPYNPFYGAKFIKYAPKNCVIISTFHIMPYNKLAYFGTWLLGRFLYKNTKLIDVNLCVSSANQSFASKTFMTNFSIVPNMVDLSYFQSKISSKNPDLIPQILFLGRLTERKGCKYLLDALSEMHKRFPDIDFRLNIAGRGEQESYLRSIVNNYGLKDKVEFLGYVTNEQKIELMKSADLAIFPSYSGESFGIVLIEAMGAGAGVVIGGDNPGYKSVIGEIDGCLIDVKDTSKFANLIKQIITNYDYAQKLHIQQQDIVKKFDYKTVGDKILRIYKSCLNTKVES